MNPIQKCTRQLNSLSLNITVTYQMLVRTFIEAYVNMRGLVQCWLPFLMTDLFHFGSADTTFLEMGRSRRQAIPLVYPSGGTLKYIFGFGTPIPNPDNATLAMSMAFQFQYSQLQNISAVSSYFAYQTVASRQQRDLTLDLSVYSKLIETGKMERMLFYENVIGIFSRLGFNGKVCLLRLICEIQQQTVDHDGLPGELLHIFFTPKYGQLRNLQSDQLFSADDPFKEYVNAQEIGEQLFKCSAIYPGCDQMQTLIEEFTELEEMF